MTQPLVDLFNKAAEPLAAAGLIRTHPDHPASIHDGIDAIHAAGVTGLARLYITRHYGGHDLTHPPIAYPPGFHATGWTVGYEGAYEWTLGIAEAQFLSAEESQVAAYCLRYRILLEPVNGWCLGLYGRD